MDFTHLTDSKATREFQNQILREIQSNNSKVLVVEDDITTQKFWYYLFDLMYPTTKVYWARSVDAAEEVMDRLQQKGQRLDLIICDVFLDGSRSGLDLWRAYREDTPFIITSGVPFSRLKSSAPDLEMAPPFIPKPLELDRAIDVLCDEVRFKNSQAV